MRIIFMGTPDFAVPSLEGLLKAGYTIPAVITATDKMGGRGKRELMESAVKKFAMEKGLHILQPKNLKDPQFLEELRDLRADLQVVVAFRMLPEVVWNMPPMGTVNLHASLLPRYRGAAPIHWAIIRGEKETGLTTFLLKQEIDTGDILLQTRVTIGTDETTGELHDKMKMLGADLVVKTVQGLEKGTLQPTPQHTALATSAPKIFHSDCEIDWERSVRHIYDLIRGLSPSPAAWCTVDGKKLKVYRSHIAEEPPRHRPGRLVSDNSSFIKVASLNGYVFLDEIQMEGKKKMSVGEFLNGYSLKTAALVP